MSDTPFPVCAVNWLRSSAMSAGVPRKPNALTGADVYVADQLFATLDTTTRQLYLGEAGRSVSLSDTVGFIRDLPHGLIDAFQATLQEAVDADLLLHVVDAASPHAVEQMAEVQRVLAEIGAADIPQVLVFNKLDALDEAHRPAQLQDWFDVGGVRTPRLFLSASGGEGLAALRRQLAALASAGQPQLPETDYSLEFRGDEVGLGTIRP
jgi:GTP-binding protein HflX